MKSKLLVLWMALSTGLTLGGCKEDAPSDPTSTGECSSNTDCPDNTECLKDDADHLVCISTEADISPSEDTAPDALTRDTTPPDGGIVCGTNKSTGVFDPTGLNTCCVAGTLVYCDEDKVCCNGSCTETEVDNANCGSCGYQCLANEVCSGGACLCAGMDCVDEEICCDIEGQLTCVYPFANPSHCGACGVVCDQGKNENCLDGQCGCLKKNGTDPSPVEPTIIEFCTAGFECCPPRPEFPNEVRGCIDLNTADDCGACGNKCPDGQQCAGGQCL